MSSKIHSISKYLISHLEKKHEKNLFSCGIAALDQYLKTQANQDIKKNVSVTYVITEQQSKNILGYYTLSSIGIFPGELPDDIIKKLPKYPVLSGVLIGRLAVDTLFQGNKIGSLLLIDALKRSQAISQQIGITAVIVDAKDSNALSFYKHFGFISLPENEKRLFIPMSTIKQLNL